MRVVSCVSAVALLLIIGGCSRVSTVERGRFVASAWREEFCRKNPESPHLDYIRNGEIIRGMQGYEVIGSWGMPNVYLVSNDRSEEYWIYYAQNLEAGSVMVYRLVFNAENILSDWEIDMKRYANFTLGKTDPDLHGPVERDQRKISIDKQ